MTKINLFGDNKFFPLKPRPGPDFDGSAQWAFQIAQHPITRFSTDAQLYCVIGELVRIDGRLSANVGNWSFLLWSNTKQRVFEVTVSHLGKASNTTRNAISPTPPIEQPIPQGWSNSTEIFHALPSKVRASVSYAFSAVLNVGNNPKVPDDPVWAIYIGEDEGIPPTPPTKRNDGTLYRIGWKGTPLDGKLHTNRLISQFLKRDPNVHRIMSGTPYNMIEINTLISPRLNRDLFAYKVYAAFHMLGYNTERDSPRSTQNAHIQVLKKFQKDSNLPETTMVDSIILEALDRLLVERESKIAEVAKQFQLYDHMQPLHRNDISKDSLAYMYHKPMKVLPGCFHMSLYETVQCIKGQGVGDIQDPDGNPFPEMFVDLSKDYRFVGAGFDPKVPPFDIQLKSAATCISTVLHEYAHYLDNRLGLPPNTTLPHCKCIPTIPFHDISFDLTTVVNPVAGACAVRRSDNPQDFISAYGFGAGNNCPEGKINYTEEFAEAFYIYVVAGKKFREAAGKNDKIQTKYTWLKNNVFQGIEYDTDLQCILSSGCYDAFFPSPSEPAYLSCSPDAIWDGEIRIL